MHFCWSLAIVVLCLPVLAQTRPSNKKVIEFGWDMPDTAFMRQHIAEMEKRPFDGCVFRVMYRKSDGRIGSLMSEAWGREKLTEAQLAPAIDDLKHTHSDRLTDNFLRLNVQPGDVDWFDVFSAVVNNARLAAKVAREGNCAGILFDTEMYSAQLWTYASQRDAKTKSFDAYAAQVRTRGREFMTALQTEFPNIKVFLTYGYSLPLVEGAKDASKLPQIHYGLLPAFLDGMLDVANDKTKIIDGFEISYGWKQDSEFDDGVKMMRKGALPLVANPDKYAHFLSSGFGLWLDRDWQKLGWNTKDVSKNYFPPEVFENSLRSALRHSDEYVWIYTQKVRWWNLQNLPPAYLKAIEDAKRE